MDAHSIIKGFVQGVGYRKFVKKHAQTLGLTGWIRNLPDGSVELLLQGEKKKIEGVLLVCQEGPFLAAVEEVNTVWEKQKETFPNFSLRHDF